jgi:hypothetical protein
MLWRAVAVIGLVRASGGRPDEVTYTAGDAEGGLVLGGAEWEAEPDAEWAGTADLAAKVVAGGEQQQQQEWQPQQEQEQQQQEEQEQQGHEQEQEQEQQGHDQEQQEQEQEQQERQVRQQVREQGQTLLDSGLTAGIARQRHSRDVGPRYVLVAGPARTGTTWLFNAVRLLVRHHDPNVISGFYSSLQSRDVCYWRKHNVSMVVKTHAFHRDWMLSASCGAAGPITTTNPPTSTDLPTTLRSGFDQVVTSFRDPFDTACSFILQDGRVERDMCEKVLCEQHGVFHPPALLPTPPDQAAATGEDVSSSSVLQPPQVVYEMDYRDLLAGRALEVRGGRARVCPLLLITFRFWLYDCLLRVMCDLWRHPLANHFPAPAKLAPLCLVTACVRANRCHHHQHHHPPSSTMPCRCCAAWRRPWTCCLFWPCQWLAWTPKLRCT